MIALIDGDICAFRCGFSCESWVIDEHGEKQKAVLPVEIAYARLNEMIEQILQATGATEYQIFLTDSDGNFRKTVSTDYKANRKDVPRPIHLKALEEFLIRSWGAVRAVGEEADDLLGITQTTLEDEKLLEKDTPSIICSIDKDLLQIPGKHYNFVKQEFQTVTYDDGMFAFYKQLLMGDSTDNIGGCPGIGEKKALKFLQPAYGNEFELFREVYEQYKKAFPTLCPEELEELITTVGRLVYIRRKPGELWSIPTFSEA